MGHRIDAPSDRTDTRPAARGRDRDRRALIAAALALGLSPWASRVALAATSPADQAAFLAAIRLDSERDVRALLLKGADPNYVTPQDGPALVTAAAMQSWQAFRVLLDSRGTKVDLPNARDETALMFVALNGQLEFAKVLVQRGAQVNRSGWTPLHYAATGGHAPMVRWLIEEHAYLDAHSPNRTTPLMMAARHRRIEALRLLIEEGADPTQRNDNGWTAADYVQRYGDQDTAGWLRERAAAFEAKYGTVNRPRTSAGN